MAAQQSINQLPSAGPITGSESVPIVQNGVTVQTTTGAIAASPSQTQTFLTVNQEPTLPNSRYFSTGTGLGLTDGGAQSFYRLSLNGTSSSLETASTGLIVKNTGSTVVARSIAISGNGLSISNADGISGNPTLALSGLAASVANLSGTGILALNSSGTAVAGRSITGTTSQISVANGNGASGNPTISIADNPALPGTGAVTVPVGNNAQQPLGSNGQIRYNVDLLAYEGYSNGSWNIFSSTGAGVTSFSAGSTGLTPSTATTGAVTLGGILAVVSGGTGTSTPSLVAGTNVSITGAWPNQTINSTATGGVTSVTGTAPVASSGGTTPAISLNASYGDTQNPYGAKTANSVLAGPTSGAAAVPTFRALTTADIPALSYVSSVGGAAPITSTGGLTPTIGVTSAALTNTDDTNVTATLGGSPTTALLAATSITLGWTGQLAVTRGGTGVATTTANFVFVGPTSGSPAAPTFRALTTADLPALPYGTGTVTSVGLSLPSIIAVTNSPVSTSGTLTGTLTTQTVNAIFAGPSSGAGAAPTFRALTTADIPALSYVTSVALALPSIMTVSGSPVTGSGTLTGTLTTQAVNVIFAGPSSGASAAPTFRSLTTADIPTIGIAKGGTGQTTAAAGFNALSPITATGDLIIGNGTNSATNLAIGTNGYVLTSNGTTASWSAATGGVSQIIAGTNVTISPTGGTGAVTINASTSGSSAYSRTSFTATAGQTVFTVTYAVGYLQVYVNGVLLATSDYTATSGTDFTLGVACALGDIVEALVITTSITSSGITTGKSIAMAMIFGY